MMMVQKTFTVELTEDEVETIVTALHNEYKNGDDAKIKYAVRMLRNGLASLINQTYCGNDA